MRPPWAARTGLKAARRSNCNPLRGEACLGRLELHCCRASFLNKHSGTGFDKYMITNDYVACARPVSASGSAQRESRVSSFYTSSLNLILGS